MHIKFKNQMKEKRSILKNKTLNEDDFNISITNEHNEQELTSMGETGKSLGIISFINFPHLNISISNKNKLFNKQFDSTYNRDNFSTYTNFNKQRNNVAFDDKIYTEVRYTFYIFYFQYSNLLDSLEKKEKEKIDINKLYEEKLIKCYKMEANVKKNKDKLDRIRNKNQKLKILICKLMKENTNVINYEY